MSTPNFKNLPEFNKRRRKNNRSSDEQPVERQASRWNDHLATRLIQVGIRDFVREYRAIPGRRYVWDFAFPEQKLLVEVQGGVWMRTRSGHSTGTGVRRDCQKLNIATLNGWRSLAFTSDLVANDEAVYVIADALGRRVL